MEFSKEYPCRGPDLGTDLLQSQRVENFDDFFEKLNFVLA